jgi:trimeric autotransporter adhesin
MKVMITLLLIGLPLTAPETVREDILFACDYENNTVVDFNSPGMGTLFADSGLDEPLDLTFDRAGNLFVANSGNNTIEEFNTSGVGTLFASAGLNGPSSLAFDSAGNLYVANLTGNTIEEFNLSGGVLSTNGKVFTSSGLNKPSGLAFDNAGNLYVANMGNSIEEFDSSGGMLSSNGTVFANASSGLDDPCGLAFDSAGNLYVVNKQLGSIIKFNSSGVGTNFATVLAPTPNGLAFDSAGNLYVGCVGGIQAFNSSGVEVDAITSPRLQAPLGVAFQSVPEPSSWALLAISLITLLPYRHRRGRV